MFCASHFLKYIYAQVLTELFPKKKQASPTKNQIQDKNHPLQHYPTVQVQIFKPYFCFES